MPIAILATGNEITAGDTLNTNAYQIAKTLSSEGLEVGLHLSCCDDEEIILQSLYFLAQTHHTLLVIGGLGPTSDDKTRFALGRFLQQPLKVNSIALQHIESYLQRTLNPEENNHQQTLFPTDATILPNPNGTAVGCYCISTNRLIALLPGPPRECLPMFHHHLLPVLQKDKLSTHQLLNWYLFGVAESEIAQRLDGLLSTIDCETGYRLDMPYLEFKVRCKDEQVENVLEIINPVVEPYIICPPGKKASQQLTELIMAHNLQIAFHDEITGGLLQTVLQQPSTHSLISFYPNTTSQFKVTLLGLDDYWQQKNRGKPINFTIKIESNGREIEETHTLIYRTLSVVYAAMELTCHRLFYLLGNYIKKENV